MAYYGSAKISRLFEEIETLKARVLALERQLCKHDRVSKNAEYCVDCGLKLDRET